MKEWKSKEKSEKGPELMNAAGLVNAIGHAGPGSSLRVRVYTESGLYGEGTTSWGDDRVGGPAVIFSGPEKLKGALVPLGGQIAYDSPPRISSMDLARSHKPIFGTVTAKQLPIDPLAEQFSYEIVLEE